jgi:hypothetical protein
MDSEFGFGTVDFSQMKSPTALSASWEEASLAIRWQGSYQRRMTGAND